MSSDFVSNHQIKDALVTLDGISELFDRIESEWQRRLPRALYPTSCWQDYRTQIEEHGYVADTRIGLGVLKDARGRGFESAAVAAALERTLRHFGYSGGTMRVQEFRDERTGRTTLLFFDEAQFARAGDAQDAYMRHSTLHSFAHGHAA
jgi:GNAT superfamily N-acetyltransferase